MIFFKLGPLQDVIPVTTNPLYELTMMKGIELKKNSAYKAAHTVPDAHVSPQDEEIVHIAVQNQNNY